MTQAPPRPTRYEEQPDDRISALPSEYRDLPTRHWVEGGRGAAPAAAAAAAPAAAPATAPAPSLRRARKSHPEVLARCRPTAERAAAAALLVGDPSARPHPIPPREEEPRRHLTVVDKPGRWDALRRNRTRVLLVTGTGAALAVAFLLVYVHVLLAQRQFQLDSLNSQVQTQQGLYQNLRLQNAELNSPQHIISMAEGQLGMIQPTNVTYLTPSSTVPGSSTAGDKSKSTPTKSAASTSRATVVPAGQATVVPAGQAPAGDADWPQIKSQLAGVP